MEAAGSNGRIYIDGGNVIISRKGTGLLTAMNLGLQGDKVIPIRQITAVELKDAGFTTGYLRLSINGRDPVGGVMEAVKDENCVLFASKHSSAFKSFRDQLQALINAPLAPTPAAPSLADELGKLAILRDQGILSNDEFNAQKAKLLG